jgi:3-methyladenine DNA glycosylase AlkD
VREALAAAADPAKAAPMQAYMKSAMPYRGVQSPTVRRVWLEVSDEHVLASADDWRDTLLELWSAAQFREERYAALELLGDRRYRAFRTLEALPLYERLIVEGAWWDLVDGIATRHVGDLLRRYPAPMRAHLVAWSTGDDLWLRRTSIICQVGLKQATDAQLLFECIEPSRRSREFFLRKAIGWALRAYAATAPAAVRAYVASHELSGLSRREALKHLGA